MRSTSLPVLPATILTTISATVLALASGTRSAAQGREVLLQAAPPPHTATAWFSSEAGLAVRGWPGEVVLPGGSHPRFGPGGELYFERTTDDGHVETARATWVLPVGAVDPRPLRAGETAPKFAPLRDTTPTGAAARFCIDAGHGGSDPGALGNGLREADINLDVCVRLQALMSLDSQNPNRGGQWNVLMTRTSDRTVTLRQRTDAANAFNARTFLSVHMNAFSDPAANGTETYCFTGLENAPAGQFRNRVHQDAITAWRLRDRGPKTANFFVLRETNMPAALLEGGFVTNPGDAARMADPNERQRLALFLLFAIQQYHGFERWDPGSGGGQTGLLKGVLYDASQGTGARLQGELVALPDGAFVTTDAVGFFQFSVPAGDQDYAATAPGFRSVAQRRTVPAGGEIWGSIGLTPDNVPTLRFGATQLPPGATLRFTALGDPGAPAIAVWNVVPQIPLVDLSVYGIGLAWPRLDTAIITGLPNLSAFGRVDVTLPLPPFGGFALHAQVLTRAGGGFRLSNGQAVRVQ